MTDAPLSPTQGGPAFTADTSRKYHTHRNCRALTRPGADHAVYEWTQPPAGYSLCGFCVVTDLTAERDRYRDFLHTICGLSHQDIDDPPTREAFWRLISRIHSIARRAIEPGGTDA